MFSQVVYIIFGHGVREPGHVRELVDWLDVTNKRFLFQLTLTVQFPGAKMYDTQIVIHSATSTKNVNLAQ